MILGFSLFLLGISFLLILLRVIQTNDWIDRLLGLDLLTAVAVSFLLLFKMQAGWPWDRDAVWILVLASFVVTWILTLILSKAPGEVEPHSQKEDRL